MAKKKVSSLFTLILLVLVAYYAWQQLAGREPEPTSEKGTAAASSDLPCHEYQALPKNPAAVRDKSIPVLSSTKGAISGTVLEVTDGDTLKVSTKSDGEIKVRLLGVDSPEKSTTRTGSQEYFGVQATKYMESLVSASQSKVYLTYDAQADKEDRYGRQLMYLWVKEGDKYVQANAMLVADGYGYTYTVGRKGEFTDLYRALQQEAMKQNRGLWGVCE